MRAGSHVASLARREGDNLSAPCPCAEQQCPAMTIDQFIEKLQEMNTGAPAHVVVEDAEGRLWDPALSPSRIKVGRSEPPYDRDEDAMFAFVIVPNRPAA